MDTGKQSLAQNVKLKCRVCSKEIYRKNYKTHLQTVHPSQNADDLSPHGQAKITSLFKPSPHAKVPGDTDVFNVDNDNVRKRRHESGESVESGYIEMEEGSSVEKKQKDTKDVDDPNDSITLQTLNDKMDKLLEVVKERKSSLLTLRPEHRMILYQLCNGLNIPEV